jgi:DNA-binding IclR family transcriptional regulator
MNNYVNPNLVKACEILKVLADNPEGILASDLEKNIEVPRTTAFRILKTLCSENMAQKRGKLFFSGPSLVQIGIRSLQSLEIRSLAIPFLADLAKNTDFTAHLAIPNGMQSLILEVHDSPHPVRVASRPGTMVPLYCSSTGKLFLAYLYDQQLDDYFVTRSFKKYTENTIVTLTEMQKEIASIKTNGYSVDDNEFHKDVWCLAAPIRGSSSQVIAAIGITGPVSQFDSEKKVEVCKHVKKAADDLSASMGYIA